MKKVLFIDRDGTLIVEPKDNFQIDSLEKLEFIQPVFTGLGKIASLLEYELVMVTNQDGLGTESFPEKDFWPAHYMMIKSLENENIHFKNIYIDRSFESEGKSTRKPGIGMLKEYLKPEYDLKNSFVIGDRVTDVKLAENLGCKAVLFNEGLVYESNAIWLQSQSWLKVYEYLRLQSRVVNHARHTNETKIDIYLDLDGKGKSKIESGIGFFDHMLDQIARHGEVDLNILCKGDLHIDEHHTIEDTGIALGEAVALALGNKKGIERYSFHLPMDEADAEVLMDFGGRPWFVWQADFKREKIGDMPTEMFHHFFKSFSDASKSNLHIRVRGENEHHKIEAVFKAFAKCIKMAKKRNPDSDMLPTTKGMI